VFTAVHAVRVNRKSRWIEIDSNCAENRKQQPNSNGCKLVNKLPALARDIVSAMSSVLLSHINSCRWSKIPHPQPRYHDNCGCSRILWHLANSTNPSYSILYSDMDFVALARRVVVACQFLSLLHLFITVFSKQNMTTMMMMLVLYCDALYWQFYFLALIHSVTAFCLLFY